MRLKNIASRSSIILSSFAKQHKIIKGRTPRMRENKNVEKRFDGKSAGNRPL